MEANNIRSAEDQSHKIAVLSYVQLGSDALAEIVVGIGCVYTIGVLAEKPPPVDFFHVLFAVSTKTLLGFPVDFLDAIIKGANML